jgi:hypothetical protein
MSTVKQDELALENDAGYADSMTALSVRSCSITTGRPEPLVELLCSQYGIARRPGRS